MWDLAILIVVMFCIICGITSTYPWSVHVPNEWELPRCPIRVSNFHQFVACPCWESHIYSVGWNIFPPLKSGLSTLITNWNVRMEPAGISKSMWGYSHFIQVCPSHILYTGIFPTVNSVRIIITNESERIETSGRITVQGA
jgi:hypothetical protein